MFILIVLIESLRDIQEKQQVHVQKNISIIGFFILVLRPTDMSEALEIFFIFSCQEKYICFFFNNT